MSENLKQAIRAINMGEEQTAYPLLVNIIRENPQSHEAELAWLWLSRILPDIKRKQQCLETVLSMNPNNRLAREELNKLKSHHQSDNSDPDSNRNYPAKKENDQPDNMLDLTRLLKSPTVWIMTVMAIFLGCILLAFIFVRGYQTEGEVVKSATTIASSRNFSHAIDLPQTFTPIKESASQLDTRSNSQPIAHDCAIEATRYVEQISTPIYSFAQVTNLSYEVTSDIAMIPILTELEDLKGDFSRIPVSTCVVADSQNIENGMDDVLSTLADFTIGATDASDATNGVHVGLTKMLDGLDHLVKISNQPVAEKILPTMTPRQSQIQLLPPPATNTPVRIPPTSTSAPQIYGSETAFVSYLRSNFSTIAGQNLQIADISVFDEGGQYPHRSVSIELSSNSANNVFAAQRQSIVYAYGEELLAAVTGYFGGQDCMVRVFEFFYDDYLSDRYFDEDRYFIGTYYVDDGWAIQKDYVIGHLQGGRQHLDVWTD